MSTSRETTQYRDDLIFKLTAAFSPEISGEENHKALAAWWTFLRENTTKESLRSREKSSKYVPDEKSIAAQQPFNRFNPDVYNLLWNEFINTKEDKESKSLRETLPTEKCEMLRLVGEFYRIAVSLDFVKQLEDQNAAHSTKTFTDKIIEADDKPDFDLVDREYRKFLSTCQLDYKTEAHDLAFEHLKTKLLRHKQRAAEIEVEIDQFESSLDSDQSQAVIEHNKFNLLNKIKERKVELDSISELDEKKSTTTIPSFPDFEDQYKTLNKKIKTLDFYLTTQQEKDKKEATPDLLSDSISELFTIQTVSQKAQKNISEHKEVVQSVINKQYYYYASFIGANKIAKDQWEKKFKDTVFTQLNLWGKQNEGSVALRITTLKNKRNALLKQENEKKDEIKEQLYRLKLIKENFEKVCTDLPKKIDAEFPTQYAAHCKTSKASIKEVSRTYDKLKTRLDKINVQKELSKIRTTDVSGESRQTLLRHTTPTPKRPTTSRVILGVVLLGIAAAAFFFTPIPIVGLAVAGAFALGGLASWVSSIYNCCKNSNTTRQVSSFDAENDVELTLPSTTRGRSTAANLQVKLASSNPAVIRAKNLGLNPDKANIGATGELQFLYKKGGGFLQISKTGFTVFNPDEQEVRAITSRESLSDACKNVASEYRLS